MRIAGFFIFWTLLKQLWDSVGRLHWQDYMLSFVWGLFSHSMTQPLAASDFFFPDTIIRMCIVGNVSGERNI